MQSICQLMIFTISIGLSFGTSNPDTWRLQLSIRCQLLVDHSELCTNVIFNFSQLILEASARKKKEKKEKKRKKKKKKKKKKRTKKEKEKKRKRKRKEKEKENKKKKKKKKEKEKEKREKRSSTIRPLRKTP